MNHAVMKLINDFLARYAGRWQGLKTFLAVGINGDASGAWPQVGFFATDDDLAKVLMRQTCWQTKGGTYSLPP